MTTAPTDEQIKGDIVALVSQLIKVTGWRGPYKLRYPAVGPHRGAIERVVSTMPDVEWGEG